jgi:preprotein translocase subunit SecE
MPAERFYILERAGENVAKTSPGEFIRQVRAETAKVHWPTRKETVQTAIMVIIMTMALAIFFAGTDGVFYQLVKYLLGFVHQ